MRRRYSAAMPGFQRFPDLWLLSDERNDSGLEAALTRLPRGSGFIYRHYHLPPAERVARWYTLLRLARARGHVAILADSTMTAREWGADGAYGAPLALYPTRDLLTLATAHNLAEIAQANRAQADAVLLSPAFPTRSHPDAPSLGPLRFRLLAAQARMPVIALGGMTAHTAHRLDWPRWAAIDGLS
ncbi:thiamine phosphate synthase [Altererythrobacter salegens]|uniref:Thiamine phosphate synthase n=1 Tax=Croceibacterium salegens TaxID=1737568 RepID=A0A6I4T014_9SPHN|nr:thiamine phosphate synthase [Croceibacterium salegens]MXO60810.1 thiamine phosphate synthase [Croceibacterium salegens]